MKNKRQKVCFLVFSIAFLSFVETARAQTCSDYLVNHVAKSVRRTGWCCMATCVLSCCAMKQFEVASEIEEMADLMRTAAFWSQPSEGFSKEQHPEKKLVLERAYEKLVASIPLTSIGFNGMVIALASIESTGVELGFCQKISHRITEIGSISTRVQFNRGPAMEYPENLLATIFWPIVLENEVAPQYQVQMEAEKDYQVSLEVARLIREQD